MKELNKELKIYELSLIWKEAEYNFAFWDKVNKNLNWDIEYKKSLNTVLKTNNIFEYYLELKRFIALLKDGHTDVSFPEEVYNSPRYNSSLPISMAYIDGEYYVVAIKECVKGVVKEYSKILKINDVDIHEYIETNILPYIWHEKLDSCADNLFNLLHMGKEGSIVKFLFEFGGEKYEVNLTRKFRDYSWIKQKPFSSEKYIEIYESHTHTIKFTNDNIAIIKVDSFSNNDLPKEIYSNFEMLQKAKGFVIDIRNNGGGNSDNATALAALFIGEKFLTDVMKYPAYYGPFKAWSTQGSFGEKTWEDVKEEKGNSKWWEKVYKVHKHEYFEYTTSTANISNLPGKLEGPLVILCSERTASAAENFILYMKHHTNAIIIGNKTYGSTGLPLPIKLESGGEFRVCTQHCYELNEDEFINKGIRPNIICINGIDDYKNRIDKVLLKGLDVIRKECK